MEEMEEGEERGSKGKELANGLSMASPNSVYSRCSIESHCDRKHNIWIYMKAFLASQFSQGIFYLVAWPASHKPACELLEGSSSNLAQQRNSG